MRSSCQTRYLADTPREASPHEKKIYDVSALSVRLSLPTRARAGHAKATTRRSPTGHRACLARALGQKPLGHEKGARSPPENSCARSLPPLDEPEVSTASSTVAWRIGLRTSMRLRGDLRQCRERQDYRRRDRSAVAVDMWPAAGNNDASITAASERPPTGSTALATCERLRPEPFGFGEGERPRGDGHVVSRTPGRIADEIARRSRWTCGRPPSATTPASPQRVSARPQGPPRLPRTCAFGLQTFGLRAESVPAGTSCAVASIARSFLMLGRRIGISSTGSSSWPKIAASTARSSRYSPCMRRASPRGRWQSRERALSRAWVRARSSPSNPRV